MHCERGRDADGKLLNQHLEECSQPSLVTCLITLVSGKGMVFLMLDDSAARCVVDCFAPLVIQTAATTAPTTMPTSATKPPTDDDQKTVACFQIGVDSTPSIMDKVTWVLAEHRWNVTIKNETSPFDDRLAECIVDKILEGDSYEQAKLTAYSRAVAVWTDYEGSKRARILAYVESERTRCHSPELGARLQHAQSWVSSARGSQPGLIMALSLGEQCTARPSASTAARPDFRAFVLVTVSSAQPGSQPRGKCTALSEGSQPRGKCTRNGKSQSPFHVLSQIQIQQIQHTTSNIHTRTVRRL